MHYKANGYTLFVYLLRREQPEEYLKHLIQKQEKRGGLP